MKTFDLTNQRFGRLVALHQVGHAANGNALWQCQCDCGNVIVTDGYRLRRGNVRSCGCLRRERSRQRLLQQPETVANMNAPITASINRNIPQHVSARNRSGVTGVSWDAQADRWLARLMIHGQLVLNRHYPSLVEAAAARRRAEREYGIPARIPRMKKRD